MNTHFLSLFCSCNPPPHTHTHTHTLTHAHIGIHHTHLTQHNEEHDLVHSVQFPCYCMRFASKNSCVLVTGDNNPAQTDLRTAVSLLPVTITQPRLTLGVTVKVAIFHCCKLKEWSILMGDISVAGIEVAEIVLSEPQTDEASSLLSLPFCFSFSLPPLALSLSLSHFLSVSPSLALSLSFCFSYSPLPLSLALWLSLSLCFSFSLSLSPSLSPCCVVCSGGPSTEGSVPALSPTSSASEWP